MRAALDLFESLLDGRQYLYGEFGIADVTAFPFLKYAVFGVQDGDDDRFHEILVEHQPLGTGYPRSIHSASTSTVAASSPTGPIGPTNTGAQLATSIVF